jgi:hypothetical protein
VPDAEAVHPITLEHLVAFIEIAFVSILVRRIKRLFVEEVCARPLQTASEMYRLPIQNGRLFAIK